MLLRILVLPLLMIVNLFSFAGNAEEFVREYTYRAGDSDSKITAREKALQQLQGMVLQEAGVSVKASFEQQEKLSGDQFTQQHQAKYSTLAQGVTETQILEERWDGETFYIKARITLDRSAINASTPPATPEALCKKTSDSVKSLLLDINNPEAQAKLIELSKQHDFSKPCNDWQYLVMDKFREKNLINDEYRHFLFESVKSSPNHLKGKLLYEVLRYATNMRAITKEEFVYVTDAVQLISHTDIRWLVEVLIDATVQSVSYDASESVKERNGTRQWVSKLEWQLSWFYELAQQGKLGKPKSMTMPEIMAIAMERMSIKSNATFYSYYMYHHQYLDDAANIKLASKLTRFIKRNLNNGSMELLGIYIKDIPNNRKVNTKVFKLLEHIEKQGKKEPYYTKVLNKLIEENRSRVAYLIEGASTSRTKRDKWLEKYNLNSEFDKPRQG